MERNRVSALQAIVAIVVVGLIAVIFLLPVFSRFGSNGPSDVTINVIATLAPAVNTLAPPTLAPTVALPTATPALPTAIPSPTTSPTPIPVVEVSAPTPVPPVPTLPPPAPVAVALTNTNSLTQVAIALAEPTVASVVTPTVVVPVATVAPVATADFRFGYIDESATCSMATQLAQAILGAQLALQVELVHFTSKDELFAALASDSTGKIDLTFCYNDPGDRHYLQEHVGFVLLLGGAYHRADSHEGQLQVVSNAESKARIQNKYPCFYKLLRAFELGPEQDHPLAVADWLVKHSDMVQAWASCS